VTGRDHARRRGFALASVTFLALALGAGELWHQFRFAGVKPNQVAFAGAGLTIDVDGSASPLVLALDRALPVASVSVSGRLAGGPLRIDAGTQGNPGADDFALRVGLVVPGTRRLDFIERQFAPDWVLKLSDLAPDGLGLDHVRFLNAVQDRRLVGLARTHPASELIREDFVWHLDRDGPFEFEHSFAVPVTTRAIWIAADGDDTGSRFRVEIDRLVIGAR
jgi:hypothetical protein